MILNILALLIINEKGINVTVSLSESMEPSIKTNSVILTADKDFSKLKKGDIISYDTEEVDKMVMHRIYQTTNKGYYTKGDNNETIDKWLVKEEDYRNKHITNFNFTAVIVKKLLEKGVKEKEITTAVAVVLLVLLITINTIIAVLLTKLRRIKKGVMKMLNKDIYMSTEHKRGKKEKVRFSAVLNKFLITSLVIATLTSTTTVQAQNQVQEHINTDRMTIVEQEHYSSVENIIREIETSLKEIKKMGNTLERKNTIARVISNVKVLEQLYTVDYSIKKETVVNTLDKVIKTLQEVREDTKEVEKIKERIEAERTKGVETSLREKTDITETINKVTELENKLKLSNPKNVNLTDIRGHWAEDTIKRLVTKGAVSGYPDQTFKPDNTITRAEFLAISIRATAEVENTEGLWYLGVYNKALKEKVITATEFRIGDMERAITRAEMSKVLIKISENILEEKVETESAKGYIKDYNGIDSSYRNYVEQAYLKGLITGYPDQTFKAENTTTRAEASAVLERLIDKSKRQDISKREEITGVREAMTLRHDDPYRPMAQEGDTFITRDGREVVLKVDKQTGILGLGQGVATEIGRVDERGFGIKHGSLGIADEVLGQPYYVDAKTGEGHYQREWDKIATYYRTNILPKIENPKNGQVVDDWFMYKGGLSGDGSRWGQWYCIGPGQNSTPPEWAK